MFKLPTCLFRRKRGEPGARTWVRSGHGLGGLAKPCAASPAGGSQRLDYIYIYIHIYNTIYRIYIYIYIHILSYTDDNNNNKWHSQPGRPGSSCRACGRACPTRSLRMRVPYIYIYIYICYVFTYTCINVCVCVSESVSVVNAYRIVAHLILNIELTRIILSYRVASCRDLSCCVVVSFVVLRRVASCSVAWCSAL